MTVPVPVAPNPTTAKRRVIRQTRRGWVLGWIGAGSGGLFVFAVLERAMGVGSRPADQVWIIPIGMFAVIGTLRAYAWAAPKPTQSQLVVTPDRLEYCDESAAPVVVQRAETGLIDVLGSAQSGQHVIVVHDHHSAVIAQWLPRWAGWTEEHVVKVLRAAGYPAARHHDIYDGRFQSQTVGQPPQTMRW